MASTPSNHDAAGTLWSLIKGLRVAMMTTIHEDGTLRSRPMATLSHAGFDDATLWFFTRAHSTKTHEVAAHRQVNLAYADPGDQTYVSVSGIAELETDRERIKSLWREPLATWFPKGVDDPEIALIRVKVESAEYWDAPSSLMVHAYGYARAKLTGEPPKPGDHGTVAFR
ncbi:pyridoxamine 5'-phosphate oxidase family protein [Azospirillum halopraeferens]|uniref:pyridoxamine 5'-phosphate oxidase family protein n=1 Tax=Azospirillum halopraeferens TaxID=34010 RepID=UPI00041875C0|nr:pyridoxamine 5'-phosphate oxidase family protein [Azospirillum halopraeferens]